MNRKGFTLIELILYIGLTSIIVVAVLNVMMTVVGTREKTQVMSFVQQELRFTMDRIEAAVRDAINIDTGNSTFANDHGVLSLAMSGVSVHPTTFAWSGSGVRVQEGTGNYTALTSSGIIVEMVRFTNLSAGGTHGTVKIKLHATDAVAGSADKTYADAMTLESSVSLRQ
jgi:Tfp pilus assembly protein PilW